MISTSCSSLQQVPLKSEGVRERFFYIIKIEVEFGCSPMKGSELLSAFPSLGVFPLDYDTSC